MHVLLVEPDPMLGATYVAALTVAGHSVSQTRSAQAAVHAADKKMPDVVILELQLPLHNGIEFLYEFRSYAEWLHIPVIINSFVPTTDYNYAPTLQNELGVTNFLHKPSTSLRQLMQAVSGTQLAIA
jgi:DNA-binding response OmpR family regulator